MSSSGIVSARTGSAPARRSWLSSAGRSTGCRSMPIAACITDRTIRNSRASFLRAALVEGDYETRAPFFAHNQRLISEIERMEHKSRRPDILVDDELIYAFYDARVPQGVHNGADFEQWRKEAERADARLLFLRR